MPVTLSNPPPNEFGIQPRPYHRRNVRWYHSHIIDWMMANPSGSLEDCAKHVGKARSTVSAIVRSDMFQAALAKRKAEYASRQDLILGQKLTEVAVSGLDTILKVLEKKKDNVDLEFLSEVTDGALKRLGYGLEQKAQAPVQVNVQQNVVAPVPVQELNEARQLMRQHQQTIAANPTTSHPQSLSPPADAASPIDALLIEAEVVEEKGAAVVPTNGEE